MKGFADEKLRALVRVPLSASRDGTQQDVLVWIDTAFNGGLVLPRKQIAELGLVKESTAEAILADGQLVELETYACFCEWFDNSYATQIVASDSEYPLLGTMLLDDPQLNIDYKGRRSNSPSEMMRPTDRPPGCRWRVTAVTTNVSPSVVSQTRPRLC